MTPAGAVKYQDGVCRLSVLQKAALLLDLRVSRDAIRRSRAHARGGDFRGLAARVDGYRLVRPLPRDS